ncbi:ATP-dependent endonuclease [Methylosinus sp. Sm6]|uniref:ATP-dependent nuclease n=1 Tax=Methylosinus sp. Sm6 TaxID=2866948 RepID=UPI001C9A196F|nr:AAA family ATPase [Methylosinus sp. Sm6]MBY6240794.1 ATP-binding protein [Methylosinus sp. Sm6]
MTYGVSQIDKANMKWFKNDNTRATLVSIELKRGSVRGVTNFYMSFEYPISALSGANGSGKSTILALAACAFHNTKGGFIPPLRTQNYYTFQDFFVQSTKEAPVEGITLHYGIRHDRWRNYEPGIGYQSRRKKKGGKWNDYDDRVKRNVIYFGVQRVVPHYERSVHRSYRSRFRPGKLDEQARNKIAKIAGRIIGKDYTDFDSFEHTKYSLPFASSGGISYSGFNMGAGESAIFEIFTALFQDGPGTLLVIDEIELGLHERAQERLIEQLKICCLELKCQIICSTHSHAILRSLPSEARFHVECRESRTLITKGISADYACGKMGKPDSFELEIFVEDGLAREVLQAALPFEIRHRSRVKAIGSHSAVMRQMASRYLENANKCICILDGDQSKFKLNALRNIESYCEASTKSEKNDIADWAATRIFYLPGSEWPERWIIGLAIDKASDDECTEVNAIVQSWGLDSRGALIEALKAAASAEKHREFVELAEAVELAVEKARSDIISMATKVSRSEFETLIANVKKHLP